MWRVYSQWWRRSSTAALFVLLLMAACGGHSTKAATPRPSAAVQQALEQAQAAEKARNYMEARRHYQVAIDVAASRSDKRLAHREMASALIFWGEYQEAIGALQACLEVDPKYVRAWHDLGLVQVKLGQEDAALGALQEAVGLAPEEPKSRIALAALLVQLGHFERALVHYRALLRLQIPDRLRRATERAIGLLKAEIAGQDAAIDDQGVPPTS